MLGTAPRRATPDSYTAMSAGGLYTTTKPKKHARVATEARGLDVAPLHDRPTKPSLSSRRPLFSKPLAVAIPPEEGPSHPSRHEPCPGSAVAHAVPRARTRTRITVPRYAPRQIRGRRYPVRMPSDTSTWIRWSAMQPTSGLWRTIEPADNPDGLTGTTASP